MAQARQLFAARAPGRGALPLGRRARRRAETRARILRAAFDLIARQGFLATTIEQITEAADVGKGTFFNYFPTKEHVLAGFAEGQVERIEKALDALRKGERPLRAVLHRLILSLGEEPARSPELVRSFFAANLASQPLQRLMRRNLERGRRLLSQLMVRGQKSGEIRSDRAPRELARFLQQNGMGILMLWSLHPTTPIAEWQEAAFELIWSGISARPKKEMLEKSP